MGNYTAIIGVFQFVYFSYIIKSGTLVYFVHVEYVMIIAKLTLLN